MSEELAIEILKQATIETTTGACKKCPRKDKNKTCIGCLDEAKEIVLNQLQQKENIIKEVREYIKDKWEKENNMEVGDYVRTKNGEIFKKPLYNTSDIVVKSSPNIIDLIEVGDYVNGYQVTMLEDEYYDDVTDSVKKIKDKEKIKIILGNEEQFYGVYAKDIKSILTKEQFENMEYRIGE